MSEYHSYVFDETKRCLVGKFEEMYQAEKEKDFDGWQQDDLRHLDKMICLDILSRYNFNRVIDVGCGKGTFTQFLKKQNNYVMGVDISETALHVAKGRFPDIKFKQIDLQLDKWVKKISRGGEFDLLVCLEALSYIKNWRTLLDDFTKICKHILISLFIPDKPIGYVKTFAELNTAFLTNFDIIENIQLLNRKKIILFGGSKNYDK